MTNLNVTGASFSGTTYTIAVDGFTGRNAGDFTRTVTPPP